MEGPEEVCHKPGAHEHLDDLPSPNGQINGVAEEQNGVAEGEANATLPALDEYMVDDILARVPFPHILKVKGLSKSWRARLSWGLSPILCPEDEVRATWFRKMVDENNSVRPKTLGPVFAGNEEFFAYDQESRVWLRIPTLGLVQDTSHLEKDDIKYSRRHTAYIAGALLLLANLSDSDCLWPNEMHVINIFTQRSKRLQARPQPDGTNFFGHWQPCGKLTFVSHKDTYKLIQFYQNQFLEACALIYDSKRDSWRRERNSVMPTWVTINFPTNSEGVFLHGIVYWLVGPKWFMGNTSWNVLTFHFEEETFAFCRIRSCLPRDLYGHWYKNSTLLLCGGSLFICTNREPRIESGSYLRDIICRYSQVIIAKIDLLSQTLVKVTEGPPGGVQNFGRFGLPLSNQGDYIIFPRNLGYKGCLAYHAGKDEWCTFPLPESLRKAYIREGSKWVSSCIQPSLNPFFKLEDPASASHSESE